MKENPFPDFREYHDDIKDVVVKKQESFSNNFPISFINGKKLREKLKKNHKRVVVIDDLRHDMVFRSKTGNTYIKIRNSVIGDEPATVIEGRMSLNFVRNYIQFLTK